MKKEIENKKGYVYILLSHDKKIYKIGSTDNIKIRMRALKRFWGEFDVKDCFAIECNREFKFRLESMLLTFVSDFQVKFEDTEKENGHTEFFHIGSLDILKTFIHTVLPTAIKDLKMISIEEIE